MCIESAFKRGGLPILRNFFHATEPLYGYSSLI